MATNLVVHCGGNNVTRDQVLNLGTPAPEYSPTGRLHVPIPHGMLLNKTETLFQSAGLEIVSEAHALARNNNHYFGVFQLAGGALQSADKDYAITVGIRNSHDKTFPAGLVLGSVVFVCDNLAFSGEVGVSRRHTTYILRDLDERLAQALGKLVELKGMQDRRFDCYKDYLLEDPSLVHDLTIKALDEGAINATDIPYVLKEWREPSREAFAQDMSAWRYFNAITEVKKSRRPNVFTLPDATSNLHNLLDRVTGVVFGKTVVTVPELPAASVITADPENTITVEAIEVSPVEAGNPILN